MAYKIVSRETTVSAAVLDAISELEGLRDECQEIVDNASDGLRETQRIQTLEETANTLDGALQDLDVPTAVEGLTVKYSEQVNKDKRSGPSRAVRCANAVSMLEAAISAVEEKLEEYDSDEESEEVKVEKEELELLRDDIQQMADEVSGCEFPGMFG